jgi:hypothetical protein
MKAHRLLVCIAVIAFVASLFQTAFLNSSPSFNSGRSLSGFECLLASLRALFSLDFTDFYVYMAGFGITNLAFPFLVGTLLTSSSKLLRTRRFFSLLAAFYALTWLLFWLQQSILHDKESHFGIGYYFWLASYFLLFAAYASKKKEPNQMSEPTAPSGRGSA